MTSKDAFSAMEKQARTTLSIFRRYINGPKHPSIEELTQQKIAIAVCCLIAAVAYYFTAQAEAYLGMSNLHGSFGSEGWRTGVFAILGAGLFSSLLLSELIPYTRLITHSVPAETPERLKTLIGQVLGIKSPSFNQQNWLAFITVAFITGMLAFIIYTAVQNNPDSENWLAITLPPLLFCLDTLFGIGPVWLLVFTILRCRMYWKRWRANRNYTRLEASWNLVAELYSGAQEWYFQEHPEINQRPEMVPPVSPLCAFIITHPCHENIVIPESIINPVNNTGGNTGDGALPEDTPDVMPPNQPTSNGAAAAVPPKKSAEDKNSKPEAPDTPLDNPADPDSDANDVTF